MRATCPGARSGRIRMVTLPWLVCSMRVFSGSLMVVCPFTPVLDGGVLSLNGGGFDEIEAWELGVQIGVALRLDAALVGTLAARGALAVAVVELVHHVHPGHDLAEGREALAVEAGIVAEVDEHL